MNALKSDRNLVFAESYRSACEANRACHQADPKVFKLRASRLIENWQPTFIGA